MKNLLAKTCGALLTGAICAWSANAVAQEVTQSTTTTTNVGTITQFTPGSESVVIRTEGGAAPVPYAITKQTIFVDESGAPVSIERVTSGLPVSVQYIREGDHMVASRVIVKRTVTTAPAAVEERTTTRAVVPVAPVPAAVEERRTTTTTTPAPPVVEDKTTTTTTVQPGVVEERKLTHDEKKELKHERKEEKKDEKREDR